MARLVRRGTLTMAIALAGASLAAPAGAAAKLDVTAHPALAPKFRASAHDYISHCGRSHPLKLRVTPAAGGTAWVVGGTRHRHSFRIRTRPRVGQQTVVGSRSKGHTAYFHIRCAPREVKKLRVQRFRRPQASLYLLSPTPSHFVAMYDTNGVPLWWLTSSRNTFNATLLPNGHVAWSRYRVADPLGWRSWQAIEEHKLSGQRVRLIRAHGSPTDIHEVRKIPNGDYLIITYRPRKQDLRPYGGPKDATVMDGIVQEITPGGKLRWQWSSRHRISISEQGQLQPPVKLADGRQVYDLVHMNSVELHDGGRRVLISTRATNAIYDIDRKTKKIVWKLGGTHTPQSIDAVDDPFRGTTLFGGQHDARVLPDGTVTLHDNGTGRSRPPRGVRYRIDEAAKTAHLVEDVSDPDAVPESIFAGSARRLPGGDWVASWGGKPVITELTSKGDLVLRLRLPKSLYSYRVDPILAGRLSKKQLRRAMDAPWRGVRDAPYRR
jgi:hypothetical protein